MSADISYWRFIAVEQKWEKFSRSTGRDRAVKVDIPRTSWKSMKAREVSATRFHGDNLFGLARIYETRYWIMNQVSLDGINSPIAPEILLPLSLTLSSNLYYLARNERYRSPLPRFTINLCASWWDLRLYVTLPLYAPLKRHTLAVVRKVSGRLMSSYDNWRGLSTERRLRGSETVWNFERNRLLLFEVLEMRWKRS